MSVSARSRWRKERGGREDEGIPTANRKRKRSEKKKRKSYIRRKRGKKFCHTKRGTETEYQWAIEGNPNRYPILRMPSRSVD